MNPFKCSPCNKSFAGKHQLTRHLESALHTGKNLRCPHCSALFNRPDALQAHVRTQHLKDSPHQCPHCNKQCTSNYQLSQHLLIHSGARPLQCPKCPATFRYTQQLKDHDNQHQGIKPYECPDCPKRFTRLQELKTHELYHTGEKPYECTQCSKRFPQHSHLKSHLRVHSGDRPFKCSKCSKKFKQSSHLRIHMSYHKGDKPFECKECGEKFRLPHTLKSHMRRHTGEKPYKCPHCPKTFSQSSPLKYHIQKMHAEGQPEKHQCMECSKAFPTQNQLNAHRRTHESKPLSCVFCEYTCRTNGDMNKHLRSHNQEKPYVCTKCGIWHGGNHKLETCQGPPTAEVSSALPILLPTAAAPVMPVNNAKKFQCKVCGLKMRHQNHLNGHMAIHKKNTNQRRRAKLTKRKKVPIVKNPMVVLERLEEDPLLLPGSVEGDNEIQIELVTETEDNEEIAILETEQVRLGPRSVVELPAVVEVEELVEEEEDDMPLCEIRIESVRHVPQEELVKLQNLRPFQCDHCNKMYKTTEELARHAEMHGEMVIIKKPEPKHQQQQPPSKAELVVAPMKKKKLKKKKKTKKVIMEPEGIKEKPDNLPNLDKTVAQENVKKHQKAGKRVEAEMPKLFEATKETPLETRRTSPRKSDELPPVLQMEVAADDKAVPQKTPEEKTLKTNLETNINTKINNVTSSSASAIICKFCNRTFGNNGALGIHLKKKHPPKSRVVSLNGKNPKSSSPIKEALTSKPAVETVPPPSSKTYKCILCQFRTTERDSLTLHARLVHYGVNRHKCSSCWKAFPTQARLEEHVLNSHDSLHKTVQPEIAEMSL